jgi:hypothetical protein
VSDELVGELAVVGTAMSNPFFSIFQQFAKGHPAGRDDVPEAPAVSRNFEDLLAERGRPFESGGTGLARCSSARSANAESRRWAGLDEVFVRIDGKLCYLWRKADHEGEVPDAVVTAKRNKAAALSFSSGS